MLIHEFLARVGDHPDLEVAHHDETICILRHKGAQGERLIRVGLWAVRQFCWERFAEACGIPLPLPA